MKLQVVNLKEVIDAGELGYYLEAIKQFKSNNNEDVEMFITKKAEISCRAKQSVTYLVCNEDNAEVAGYFTLAFKIMDIPLAGLSKTLQKDLEKNGQSSDNSIQIPGVLLAQWSKNFASSTLVSGKDIMEFIEKYFLKIQNLAGGNFLFLECEADRTGLLKKYEEYGYKAISDRLSKENKPLIQFIKKI